MWKRDVTAGLVVIIPLLVSVYAVVWLYRKIAAIPLSGLIEHAPTRVVVVVLGFFALAYVVGWSTRTVLGPSGIGAIDWTINLVPGLRIFYNATQIAVETAVSNDESLRRPVTVFTWDGLRMTAFQTGKYTADGRLVLFLPTSPNVTSGYVIEVDPENVTVLDQTVETALTRVVSAGFAENEEGKRRNESPSEPA